MFMDIFSFTLQDFLELEIDVSNCFFLSYQKKLIENTFASQF